MSDKEVGSELQLQHIASECRELVMNMDRDVLEKMVMNMDQRQLGLKPDMMLATDSIEQEYTEKVSKVFIEISVEWTAHEFGIQADDLKMECDDWDKCRVWKRIVFIMNIFDNHFMARFVGGHDAKSDDNADFIDIFMKYLSDYNGVALLNDLEHIRDHKGTIPSMECQYAHDNGECIGEMMRQYRDSHANDTGDNALEEYMNGLRLRERNVLETMAKIHSFICHEKHDEKNQDEADGDEQVQQSKDPAVGRRKEELNSKFVNEMQSVAISKDTEAKRMEDLGEELKSSGLSDDRCFRLMNELRAQSYDSDAIVLDLVDEENDPFNLYHDSNLFPIINSNPFFAKVTKKHFGAQHNELRIAQHNDDDPLPIFKFGSKQLFHWQYFKDRPGFVGSPNFGSLKEECLNNEICAMTLQQFSTFLLSAFTLQQTTKGRQLTANYRYDDNEIYEVIRDSPLSVSHIFCLLMYCNLTDLQYRYKKYGCRESEVHDSFDDLKKRNRQIAIWHRLLFEAVLFFGERVKSKKVFYTGLNVRLSFETFKPLIYAPISTTISVDIANRFCGSSGLILKLAQLHGSWDPFFNVEWLSDFANEKERLFVFAEEMIITDIQYFEGLKLRKNAWYIKAYTILSALFKGHFIFLLFGKGRKGQRRCLSLLLDVIRVYRINNGIDSEHVELPSNNVPLYLQQLFYHFVNHILSEDGRVWTIPSQFKLLSEELQRELLVYPEEASGGSQMIMSPFVASLCDEQHVITMDEYVWTIDDETLSELRNIKESKWIYSDFFLFTRLNAGSIKFRIHLSKDPNDPNGTGVGIRIHKTPFTVDLRYSVICDEAGWNENGNNPLGVGKDFAEENVAFNSSFIDEKDMLTIRFALFFSPTKR